MRTVKPQVIFILLLTLTACAPKLIEPAELSTYDKNATLRVIYANTPERESDPISQKNFEAAVGHAEERGYLDIQSLSKLRRRSQRGWPYIGETSKQLDLERGPADVVQRAQDGDERWIYLLKLDAPGALSYPYINERIICIRAGSVTGYSQFIQIDGGAVGYQANASEGSSCGGGTYATPGAKWVASGGISNMKMIK